MANFGTESADAFIRCISGRRPAERSNALGSPDPVRHLLMQADTATDNPPSDAWLPAYAAILRFISEMKDEWLEVSDRFVNMSQRLAGFVRASNCAEALDKALEEMTHNLTGRFPPFEKDLSLRSGLCLPGVVDRDDVICAAVSLSDEIRPNNRVRTVFEDWIRSPRQPECSANLVASAVCFVLCEGPRSTLYSIEQFGAAVADRQLMAEHLSICEELLRKSLGDNSLEPIRQLLT